MIATTAVRRGGVFALALGCALALMVGLSTQAAAAEAEVEHFKGEAAFADWQFDDERNTEVDVAALKGRYLDSPLDPRKDIFLSVNQEFCDGGEQVHRHFFASGFEEQKQESVSIDGVLLSSGSATLKGTVHGFEIRERGCDDGGVEPVSHEFKDLGEFDVRLDASWTGTGMMDPDVDSFHFADEDFVFNSASVQRSRDAEAGGTLWGLREFGVPKELGTTRDAKILSIIDSEVRVSR